MTEAASKMNHKPTIVLPGTFDPENHFYQRTLKAQAHPIISYFFSLSTETLLRRYCHLHPDVNQNDLKAILSYKPKYFPWSGADLFKVTNSRGERNMIVIETNSCPSGQKSTPFANEEKGGYLELISKTFKPYVAEEEAKGNLVNGGLAVIYDKNKMEASGYAATMADVFQEKVYLVEWYSTDENPAVRFNSDRVLEVADESGVFHPIRAAFRYVTDKPWGRLPVNQTKTLIINSVCACLAGGRNKALASKAYDLFNQDQEDKQSGFQIRCPLTIRDVKKDQVKGIIQDNFGGRAVVKIPYSNAGQGVFTITNETELDEFLEEVEDAPYDNYIIQSLVGNYKWTSTTNEGRFFHIGTIPDKSGNIYVCDLRMMIHFDCVNNTFRPLAGYARRARSPLSDQLESGTDSWDMLGTNLSVKKGKNSWDTETSRLLLFDVRDFNRLGVSLDDLIDGFFQTVFSTVAIDKMASQLREDGEFDLDKFRNLNADNGLIAEITL